MSRAFWVCFVWTVLTWIGVLVNLVFFIIDGQTVSLVAAIVCGAIGGYTTYLTFDVARMERERKGWR